MFYYVDGVCGSGKTYIAIQKMAKRVKNGETLIYATETKKLLNQTKEGLESLGAEVELIVTERDITSSNKYQPISQKLLSSINNTDAPPRVILCITKSLISIATSVSKINRLPLVIDEGFTVVDTGQSTSLTEGEAQGIATRLKLDTYKPEGYSPDSGHKLSDDNKLLQRYMANSLYQVEHRVSEAKFEWVVYLDVVAFLDCFSSVTLLSACHEDTLQYIAINKAGCKQKALDWGLATKHHSKAYLGVYWVLETNEWRTNSIKGLTDEQWEEIRFAFEGKHFSNDILSVKGLGGKNPMSEIDGSLPVMSHGFNDASSIHHVLNLHTQMPTPYLGAFLKKQYDMTPEQIRVSFYQYGCYQAVMRCSLRKSTKANPSYIENNFCFGDKSTAKYFISKLDSSIEVNSGKLDLPFDLDTRKERIDKVSRSKQEQKNRGADKKKLLELGLEVEVLDDARIYLRGWRRENKGKRVTKKLYSEVVEQFT
tara:strand:- start:268 stop:1713 length:1446 start_codon:yes stop_codon:yes gene_type:complete